MRLLALAAVLLLAAGCVSGPAPTTTTPTMAPAPMKVSVLAGAAEPGDLAAPTFKLLGAVATGGPAYSAGEPSIRATLDGLLYVAFPGCDTPSSILLPVDPPGQPRCDHGVVYKSGDRGATWSRLNDPATGRLAAKGPAANGDAEVAVDANGTVYASNLGAGIHVQKSVDGGKTWSYVADVVPKGESADRQWMAAAHPGHLVMAWMGSLEKASRSVILNTTFDGGATWTGAVALGDNIGWIGPVQFSPDGSRAYVVYTQPLPLPSGLQGTVAAQQCSVMLGVSRDGGRTWSEADTGARITTNQQGGHWSCVNMAPALDVTGDGHLVAAWSEDVESAADLTATGAVVKYTVGDANAANWTAPAALSTAATAIMPWVAGGAGDRFAVTYFTSNVPADPDYAGSQWALEAAVVDGGKVVRTVVDPSVHEGGICSRGGGCFTSGSDRFLLDFFQNDVLPDGRLVIVYPANPASGARFLEIRVAVQEGGSPLLVPPTK